MSDDSARMVDDLGIEKVTCTWCDSAIPVHWCTCDTPCSKDHCPMLFVDLFEPPPVPKFRRSE